MIKESDLIRSGLAEESPVEVLDELDVSDIKNLLIYNDDFNTFDHVINTLIRICNHTLQQAEQCTWLIHYKGKCSVKKGPFEELKPKREAICGAGIDARIQ